jgi:hypothetical protein
MPLTRRQLLSISPLRPHILDVSLLNDSSTYEDIQRHLWHLRASLECYTRRHHSSGRKTPWLLHTRPMAFTSRKEKANWRCVPDMHRFHCFSDLWFDGLPWQTGRLGVFCTKAKNWVGQSNWADIPFHVWAAYFYTFTENNKKRRLLIIYDCNASVDHELDRIGERDLKIAGQKALIQYCIKKYSKNVVDVWIIGEPGGNPNGLCLQLTCQWVHNFIQSWPTWDFTTEALRRQGYIRVELSREGELQNRTLAYQKLPDGYEAPTLRSKPAARATRSAATRSAATRGSGSTARSSTARRERKRLCRSRPSRGEPARETSRETSRESSTVPELVDVSSMDAAREWSRESTVPQLVDVTSMDPAREWSRESTVPQLVEAPATEAPREPSRESSAMIPDLVEDTSMEPTREPTEETKPDITLLENAARPPALMEDEDEEETKPDITRFEGAEDIKLANTSPPPALVPGPVGEMFSQAVAAMRRAVVARAEQQARDEGKMWSKMQGGYH